MLFDPQKVPFSTRESFLCISWLEDGFWLRSVRGGDEETDLGRLLRVQVLSDGQICTPEWSLAPEALTARLGEGWLSFAFDGGERIVVAGQGLGLRLSTGASKYNYAQEAVDHVHVSIAKQDLRCEVWPHQGAKRLTAPWTGLAAESISLDLLSEAGVLAATLDIFRVTPSKRPFASFKAASAAAAAGFAAFHAALTPCLPEHAEGHRLAAYILWSAYVPTEGMLTQPAVYMSKNWMTNIWSWDHCFVALALPPALAWQQMQVIFAAQHPSGRLPDYINDCYALWAFTKPPVHGWTFAQLAETDPEQVLRWLTLQAENWLNGPSLNGLPAYRHGNDAGWDNATPFAEGAPVVTPDLTTFLILQLEEIARLHRRIGQNDEAAQALSRADALYAALIQHLWTPEGFTARHLDGRLVASDNSLLLLLPLLLASRITSEMRDKMLTKLRNPEFLTPWGLATEATTSPLYRANGYWRGPIWAPTTLLFVDALDRCGQSALADEIARRYLRLCQHSGMAENFDAQSGAGLHDPAFAWTSAVYIRLAARLNALPG